MARLLKAVAMVGAGLSLTSISVEPRLSPDALRALDPTRIAGSLCGSGAGAGSGLSAALLTAGAIAAPLSRAAPIPLYRDLAKATFPVTTGQRGTRRYFSQGLNFLYGFNHSGAVRSFREAYRRDPACAMCFWGEAVALGPNINAPMDQRDHAAAVHAMNRAMALRDKASPMERALIEAAALRYSAEPVSDRAALDAAYADAMLDVARRFPADDDVAVLAAEAAMDTTPWNYWEADRKTPIGRTAHAVRLVEAVLASNPGHWQAAHLYIHLLEASDPQRAEAAADRFAGARIRNAAHLVHMPGHIYYGLGRHADSIRVNIAAARADEAFIRGAGDNGLVRYGYYPHNVHFIVTSAQMAGDMHTAIREVRRLQKLLDPATSSRIAWIQAIDAAPYLTMAQFAAPDAILAMPAPDPRLPYAVAIRHYARAVAHAQRRDQAGFDRELAAIDALQKSDVFADMVAQGVPAPDILLLAQSVARARFATVQGQYAQAAAHYREAIAIEDRLPYTEPPYWGHPVRQSLGAVLFLAGRYDEASRAFREALARGPQNGWALYGLARSEAAQARKPEAAAAQKAFLKAWKGEPRWLRMERL